MHYDTESIRQATCESYGCCWGANPELGYQCYATTTQLDEPGCMVAADAPVTNDSTATTKVTQCGAECCRGDTVKGDCAWSLGFARRDESPACGRFEEAAKKKDVWGWFYHGPDVRASCSHLEGGNAANPAECKAACHAMPSCNAVNYHEKHSICEMLDCGIARNPPPLTSVIGFGAYVWASAIDVRWDTTEW